MAKKKSNAVVRPNLGLYLGRPAIQAPKGALIDGNNFRVRYGQLTNADIGYTRISGITLDGPVLFVTDFNKRNANPITIIGTTKSLYSYDSTGPSVTQIYTGSTTTHWDFATFLRAPGDADYWYATNGIDYPQRWDGVAASTTDLSSLAFKCKYLATFKNMLLYCNITEDAGTVKETTVKNSDVATPEELATGLAGEYIVHSGTDPIFKMLQLGDNMVFYGKRNLVLMQFVESPTVFTFRQPITGTAPISGKLITDFGDHHRFMSRDTQYRFDGAFAYPVASENWRHILALRDDSRIDEGYVMYDEPNGDLIWGIPLTTDSGTGPDTAYVEHFREVVPQGQPTPMSKRDFPFTGVALRERQQVVSNPYLVGDTNGYIYTFGSGVNANGAAMASYVHTGRLPMGDGYMRALLRRVFPYVSQQSGVNLDITPYFANTATGPASAANTVNYSLSLLNHTPYAEVYRRGRYMELEFGTGGPDEQWELSGWDIDVVGGGLR